RDSFVTISLPNGIEFYEAVAATWKVGATPQPLAPKLPGREREAIIELADPSLVVGTQAEDRPCVPAGFEPASTLSDEPLPPAVAACWKAPTSGGSTGRPKVIVSTQPSMLSSLVPLGQLFGMVEDAPNLVTGPLFHNGPLLMSLAALLMGGHVVVMTRFDASHALRLVEQHRIDWMYAVPTM